MLHMRIGQKALGIWDLHFPNLRLLVVAGISRFGAKSALAVLSGSPTAAGLVACLHRLHTVHTMI